MSAPAAFNYSEAEWSDIESAVHAVHNGPLPKRMREHLVGEARWYLAAKDYPTKPGHEQRAWRRIADRTERLWQDISALIGDHVNLLECAGCRKTDIAKLRRYYEDDFGALSAIRNAARDFATLNQRYGAETKHFDNPKMMYEFKVLSIWTKLGGELRRSRHPRTKKIQGPLARFFRAVTVPVMGANAPSLESLPDIIRRQQRFVAFENNSDPTFQLLLNAVLGPHDDHRAKLD
jgi:hypothetical protein